MSSALVGYSGFVGSTLLAQRSFDDLYRSTNIGEIAGRSYDLLICAGASAAKWLANSDPQADKQAIERLQSNLAQCRAKQFVLISTVDVYASPREVDESTPIDPAATSAYGRHRFELEEFVRERFERVLVIRLPGLFGKGLKKNLLRDLLTTGESPWTDHRSQFQFYDMSQLWNDCEKALRLELPLVNFATEPVAAAEVAQKCLGVDFRHETTAGPVRYDMQTEHAARFGAAGRYLYSAEETFARLADWARQERAG